jgi:hypothetical protein
VQWWWWTEVLIRNVQLSKCKYHTYRHVFNFSGIADIILLRKGLTITNIVQHLFLGCLHHREYYKENGHCIYVNNWEEYLWIYWSYWHYLPRRSMWFIHLIQPNKNA